MEYNFKRKNIEYIITEQDEIDRRYIQKINQLKQDKSNYLMISWILASISLFWIISLSLSIGCNWYTNTFTLLLEVIALTISCIVLLVVSATIFATLARKVDITKEELKQIEDDYIYTANGQKQKKEQEDKEELEILLKEEGK